MCDSDIVFVVLFLYLRCATAQCALWTPQSVRLTFGIYILDTTLIPTHNPSFTVHHAPGWSSVLITDQGMLSTE